MIFRAIMNSMTDFDKKIYHDEPLRRPDDARRRQILPQEIIDMRNLARQYPAFSLRRECFYRQAVLMQDFEDHYYCCSPFDSWYPAYEDMDDDQLRVYFTWRKIMRQHLLQQPEREIKAEQRLFSTDPGQELAVHLSFLYVFIYELLEGIHVTDPEEGLRQLEYILKLYGPYSRGLENNLRTWIGQYCVYYDLDPKKAGEYLLTDKSRAINCLRDLETRYIREGHDVSKGQQAVPDGDVKALCEAAGVLLGKPLKSSIFCARNEKRAYEIFFGVYMEVDRYLAANHKPMLLESCAGMHTTFPVRMFGAAVWYDWKQPEAFVYRIDENHAYRCSRGVWQIETYESEVMPSQRRQNLLSAIWHETDRLMRERYHFGHPLAASEAGAMFMPLILKVIAAYQKDEEMRSRPQVNIDFSRLAGIRRDALHTQEQLITEEEYGDTAAGGSDRNAAVEIPERSAAGANTICAASGAPVQPETGNGDVNTAEPEQPSAGTDTAPAGEPAVHLGAQQREFLIRLLDNGNWQEYVRKEHLVLSILIDEINDAFYEIIGDTVIEQDGSGPVIIEDYREDVRSACQHP